SIVPLMAVSTAVPGLMRSTQAANEATAVANLRTIVTAEMTYAAKSRGDYGDIPALMAAGLLDSRFASVTSGYQISVSNFGRNFTAMATPVSRNTGRYGYYVVSDGVIRYSSVPALAPAGQAGHPVQ